MTTIEDPKLNTVLNYFSYMNESETFTFTDGNNEPDVAGARVFAEKMRKQFGGLVDQFVSVEQRVNRVIIKHLTM